MPSMPCCTAARMCPAPIRRATAEVVPYARKIQTLTRVASAAAAAPKPASGAAPRCPTMAASASWKTGSAMSAPRAGTASRQISRSRVTR